MRNIADSTGRKAKLFTTLFACTLLLTGCGVGSGFDGYKFAVNNETATKLEISTRSVPAGHADATYPSTQLNATGASGPIEWTLADGSLPEGMFLTRTGLLNGTPTLTGLFPITVRAADAGREDSQSLLVAVDAFGVAVLDGLCFGEAWSGEPITLSTAGGSGSADFEIVNDDSQGHLTQDGTYVPGSAGAMDATVTLQATDRNTGAQADLTLVVRPNPLGGHVARFSTTDVWLLDFDLKRGSHPYHCDAHAAWASFGLRGRASLGSLGSEADQLADLVTRRQVLKMINTYFLREEDGTAGAEGLGISFTIDRPHGQYAAPVPGGVLPGASTNYSIMSFYDAPSRTGYLGAAVLDSANSSHVNNSSGAAGGELGVFLQSLMPMIGRTYRMAERELLGSPVNDDDLPILRALLHDQDVTHYGQRGADLTFAVWAIGRSLAAVAAHEIAHSCGLEHNAQTQRGALMNYTTTIHADAEHFFLPHNLEILRSVLAGPGRHGTTQSKLGTRETLAAQAAFLGGGGVCLCNQ